jgi:hypothetical protein
MGEVVCHQRLVRLPLGALALLVEVEAEDVGAAERAGLLDQPAPGGVVAQDVADHQLAPGPLGGGDHARGVRVIGRQRLLDEDMRTRPPSPRRRVGVAVGVGGDHDQIGLLAIAASKLSKRG